MDLKRLQSEIATWAEHNFPGFEPWQPLVGIMEELGELAHHHLKRHQRIRSNEDHDAGIRDAIGDAAIFLINYCDKVGLDFESVLSETWQVVQRRRWRTDVGAAYRATEEFFRDGSQPTERSGDRLDDARGKRRKGPASLLKG